MEEPLQLDFVVILGFFLEALDPIMRSEGVLKHSRKR